jgi:hypothetical protein
MKPELVRQAIGYLASTLPTEQAKRMNDNAETLRYAYNTKWTVAETQKLIEFPSKRREVHTKDHKRATAREAYARVKSGESLYHVAQSMCMDRSNLEQWMRAHTDFTTMAVLRGVAE